MYKGNLRVNDNLTSILLAGPAVLSVLPLANFNFDILVLLKDPYCILLLSVMPVDAAQKNMMKFGWLRAEIWEFYFRRYFRQDITQVKLSLILGENCGGILKKYWKISNWSWNNLRKILRNSGENVH